MEERSGKGGKGGEIEREVERRRGLGIGNVDKKEEESGEWRVEGEMRGKMGSKMGG